MLDWQRNIFSAVICTVRGLCRKRWWPGGWLSHTDPTCCTPLIIVRKNRIQKSELILPSHVSFPHFNPMHFFCTAEEWILSREGSNPSWRIRSTILVVWKTPFWSSYEECRAGVEVVGRCSRLLKVWSLPWEKMNAGLEQTSVAQKK